MGELERGKKKNCYESLSVMAPTNNLIKSIKMRKDLERIMIKTFIHVLQTPLVWFFIQAMLRAQRKLKFEIKIWRKGVGGQRVWSVAKMGS